MEVSVSKLNKYLFFKIPSAFICGIRVKSFEENKCVVTVKYSWINQNPFHSIHFAIQAMAGELSTGVLVMNRIQKSGKDISMLVASNKSVFSKKARGLITFRCTDGEILERAIQDAINTEEGQTFWMKAIGTDEKGDQVSEMDFEWSIRLKIKKE